ncbi:MAG: hypothetical protein M1833_002211 [Piccolia ochrophora]|nr:MAG: hypothetical protein M1833_002211 [Piccolia ochrophora]
MRENSSSFYTTLPPSMTESSSDSWFPFDSMSPAYYQESSQPQPSQTPFPDVYDSPLRFPYAQPPIEGPPYVYQFPQAYCQLGSGLNTQHCFAQDIDMTSAEVSPISDAFPPSSYLMDPQKHQSYMSLPCQQATEDEYVPLHDQHNFHQPNENTEFGGRRRRLHVTPDPAMSPTLANQDVGTEPGVTPGSVFMEGDVAQVDDEETDGDEHEPYAKLIYRALMSVPEHKMVLKEIYDWFDMHTDKNRDPLQKGWQNSIRHNLSMNGAFKKVEQDNHSDETKKGFVWVLDPSAITEGVKSTTRYRKTGSSKKGGKTEVLAARRQASGRRGGRAARRARSAKASKKHKTRIVPFLPPARRLSRIISSNTVPRTPAVEHQRPVMADSMLEDNAHYPYYLSSAPPLSQVHYPCAFPEITGVTEQYSNGLLFCDSPDTGTSSVVTDYSLDEGLPEPFYATPNSFDHMEHSANPSV